MNKRILSILSAAVIAASLAGCAVNNSAKDELRTDYAPASSSSSETNAITEPVAYSDNSASVGVTLKNQSSANKQETLKLGGASTSFPSTTQIPSSGSSTPGSSTHKSYTPEKRYSIDCFTEGEGTLTASHYYTTERMLVEIYPVPAEGYKLVRIDSSYEFEGNSFEMPAKDVTITAVFEKIDDAETPTANPDDTANTNTEAAAIERIDEPAVPEVPTTPEVPADVVAGVPETPDNTPVDVDNAAFKVNPNTGLGVGVTAAVLFAAAGCAIVFRKRK